MNKPLILIVEDDAPIRNLISVTLEAHGYRHITAGNAGTALMEATSHNPDILLLDLGLPDMDGVEVIRKIRSWSNMPIIVISARSEDADKIAALDAGADDMEVNEDSFVIYTEPSAYTDVHAALTDAGYEFVESEVEYVPSMEAAPKDEKDLRKLKKMIDFLEDNDDVQKVHHNCSVDLDSIEL